MRVKILIRQADSGEWVESGYIDLVRYSEAFKKEHPGLPFPDVFISQYVAKKHKIEIEETIVLVDALYDESTDGMSVGIFQNGVNFYQVMAPAFYRNGGSSSIIFLTPGIEIPVNLIFERQ